MKSSARNVKSSAAQAGGQTMTKLKSLGGRWRQQLSRWRTKTMGGGRSDEDEDGDFEEDDERNVKWDADTLAKDVLQEMQREMESSDSASAHSTVSDAAGVGSHGRPQAESGPVGKGWMRLRQKSSLSDVLKMRSGGDAEAGAAGGTPKGTDPEANLHELVARARHGIVSTQRKGSFNILNDDEDRVGDGVSRQDFARRRFTMSSTSWRLHGLHEPEQMVAGKEGTITPPSNVSGSSSSVAAPIEDPYRSPKGGTPPWGTPPGRTPDDSFGAKTSQLTGRLTTVSVGRIGQLAEEAGVKLKFEQPGSARLAGYRYKDRDRRQLTEERVTLALNGSGGLLQCPLDVAEATPVQICNVSNITECIAVYVGAPYDDAFQITYNADDPKAPPLVATFAVSSNVCLQEWLHHLMPSKAAKSGTDMFKQVRALVSGNRRRYQEDGFDLDLSYITPRCIAMAFPGQDTVGPFSIALRNDMKDVRRFFDEKHRGCCKIFNLCAEKTYDGANFGGRVEHMPFLDHNPPTLRQLKNFISQATRWCQQKRNNVVAVHCKGGKGRTGVVVACWLLADAFNDGSKMTVEQAVEVFTKRRTMSEEGPPQGPTCASQLRYIEYFERALLGGVPNRLIRITSVRMKTVPIRDKVVTYRPYLKISCGGRVVYAGFPNKKECYACGSADEVVLDLRDAEVIVKEDFKMEMFHGKPNRALDEQKLADKATFFLCLHTGLVGMSPVSFEKSDVDGPHKDASCKRFRAEFKIVIEYEERSVKQKYVQYNEDIEERVLQKLGSMCKPYKVRSGETLTREKDKSDQRIFLVAEGSVRVEKLTPDGQHVTLENEPFICGEEGFLYSEARHGDVVTNQDTLVYAVKPDDVATIFGEDTWRFYSILAIHLAHKQKARSRNTAAPRQETTTISKKYSHAHSLPLSEIVISSGRCVAASKTLCKGLGNLVIMRRYILFHATSWSGGTSLVMRARDVLRVDGPTIVVGSGGLISLTVRVVAADGCAHNVDVRLSFSFIHVASEIAEHLRDVTRRLHDFRMISQVRSSDLAAHAVLEEIFKYGDHRDMERFTVNQEILSDRWQRLYCVIHGHGLLKSSTGAVVDRLETGDIVGEIAFIEQENWQSRDYGSFVAGKHGVIVVSASFDQIRAMLEVDADLANRFYEYVTKVMYRRLNYHLYNTDT